MKTKSGRVVKKPKEMYVQDCVMMATVKENARVKIRRNERVQRHREKVKDNLKVKSKKNGKQIVATKFVENKGKKNDGKKGGK